MRIQGVNELFGRDRFGLVLMKSKPDSDKRKEACDDTHQCPI